MIKKYIFRFSNEIIN